MATYNHTFNFIEHLSSSASLITDATSSHLSDSDPETSDEDGIPMTINAKFSIAIALSLSRAGSHFSDAEVARISLHVADVTLFSAAQVIQYCLFLDK